MVDDTSFRSNLTVLTRYTRPESGRLQKGDFYHFLFGQLHSKILLLHLQIILTVCGIFGLIRTSLVHNEFEPLPIPGIDGQFFFWYPGYRVEEINPMVVTLPNQLHHLPYRHFAKNCLNCFSHMFLISVALSFYAANMVERLGSKIRRPMKAYFNPSLLFIPLVMCMGLFVVPLSLWTIRVWRTAIVHLSQTRSESPSMAVLEALRYVLLSTVILWVLYAYLLYGVSLGFVYYWRRGQNWNRSSEHSIFTSPGGFHRGSFSRRSNRRRSISSPNSAREVLPKQPSAKAENEPVKAATEVDCEIEDHPGTQSVSKKSGNVWFVRHLETVDEESSRSSENSKENAENMLEATEETTNVVTLN